MLFPVNGQIVIFYGLKIWPHFLIDIADTKAGDCCKTRHFCFVLGFHTGVFYLNGGKYTVSQVPMFAFPELAPFQGQLLTTVVYGRSLLSN